MFNKDFRENRFYAIDPPSGYTTYYNLKKYDDGDNPGAAALNEDKDTIDAKIYSASLDNLNAVIPLVKNTGSISLSTTSNLKITSNALDTIQPIRTTNSPTFASMYLNDNLIIGLNSADTSYVFISGTLWTRGTISTLGSLYTSGSIYTKANSVITGSSYISGSTFQSGSIFSNTMIGTKKLYVNKYEETPTGSGWSSGSEVDDFSEGIGTPPNIDFYVSGASELRGNLLITGSLITNATAHFGNDLTVIGSGSFTGELIVTGSATLNNGIISKQYSSFEQGVVIGDSNGHAETLYVKGETAVSGTITSHTYTISKHFGNSAGAPLVSNINDGDTYWDTSAGRGYMFLSGSWRQIT